jgi:uncharacterized protein DUF3352
MRRLAMALCVVLTLAFAACGDEPQRVSGPAALKYVPADASAVVMVPTDFDGEQLQRLEKLLEPALGAATLRKVAATFFEDPDVDFERDVEPLLGKDLILAAWGDPDDSNLLLVLETPDGKRAGEVMRTLDIQDYRVDGDTLRISVNGGAATLAKPAKGFDPAAFGDDPGPALVRLAGDGRAFAKALDVDVDLPWIQALQGLSGSIRLEPDAITAHAHVSTDGGDLSDEDLPLAAGDDAPQVPDLPGALGSGNRNQSQTTVFLAQLARKAYPDSDFVAEVEFLEEDLGISFEEEVLKQFNGPSASVAWPDGSFAAVSDIDDRDRMRALLPKLAPRLPDILTALESLGNRGLLALLLVAPDAPLVPGALPLLQGGDIGVHRLPNSDLYELAGLDQGGVRFEVPQVVFGVLDDRFVVATDLAHARQAVAMDVSDVDDAHGAAVGRADLSTVDTEAFGLGGIKLGKSVGELEADTDGVDARLRIEVPGGLD